MPFIVYKFKTKPNEKFIQADLGKQQPSYEDTVTSDKLPIPKQQTATVKKDSSVSDEKPKKKVEYNITLLLPEDWYNDFTKLEVEGKEITDLPQKVNGRTKKIDFSVNCKKCEFTIHSKFPSKTKTKTITVKNNQILNANDDF
jgi:hypothetical protein